MKTLKFKRGLVPKNQIIGQAHKLGLQNDPSNGDEDCCFIKNGWLIFGEVGSPLWEDTDYTEITEKEFMELTTLKS